LLNFAIKCIVGRVGMMNFNRREEQKAFRKHDLGTRNMVLIFHRKTWCLKTFERLKFIFHYTIEMRVIWNYSYQNIGSSRSASGSLSWHHFIFHATQLDHASVLCFIISAASFGARFSHFQCRSNHTPLLGHSAIIAVTSTARLGHGTSIVLHSLLSIYSIVVRLRPKKPDAESLIRRWICAGCQIFWRVVVYAVLQYFCTSIYLLYCKTTHVNFFFTQV